MATSATPSPQPTPIPTCPEISFSSTRNNQSPATGAPAAITAANISSPSPGSEPAIQETPTRESNPISSSSAPSINPSIPPAATTATVNQHPAASTAQPPAASGIPAIG